MAKRKKRGSPPPKKEEPKKRTPIKIAGGNRDIIGEFCPKCNRPKDKRKAAMCLWADPDTCQYGKDCPLRDPFAPKNKADLMKVQIGNRTKYLPRGPITFRKGKVKVAGYSSVVSQRQKEWVDAHKKKREDIDKAKEVNGDGKSDSDQVDGGAVQGSE